MKNKINYILFSTFFSLLFFSFSFFLKAQDKIENNTENDSFYQKKINLAWQNNQIDSTLFFYQSYLEALNLKKETEKYILFQVKRLKVAYLVGNTEVIEKSIQELKELKLNPKKEAELIHQITFQEAKYQYWKGFYQKAVDLFKNIPNYEVLKSYQLANRYANVADMNLDFLKIERFEDTKFETASEQTELLSQLFTLYGMPKEALLFAQKSIDYLPQVANEIEKVNVQIEYVEILFFQNEIEKGQVLLSKIQEITSKYALQTELELRWYSLSLKKLLIERQTKKIEALSDSVWMLCQKLPTTSLLLQTHILLRNEALTQNRKLEESEELLNHYIEVFTELYTSNAVQNQRLYAHKSLFYFYKQFYQKAIEYSDKIIENPIAEVSTEINAYKMNALSYFKLRNYDSALFYTEAYLDLTKTSLGHNHLNVALGYYLFSTIYKGQGNLQQAIEYAKRAIEINELQEQPNSSVIAVYHQAIANAYLKLEDSQKALFHNLESQKILEKVFLHKKNYALGQIYTNLGIVYRNLNNYDSAYYYHHLSLAAENSLPEKNRNHVRIGKVYNNLGYAFEMQHNYDSAIYYYDKSLVEKEKSSQIWHSSNVLNNLANCFEAISDFKKAEDYYNQSLDANRVGNEFADLEVALDSYKGLGGLSVFSFSQRIKYYRKADELIDKMRSQLHTANDQLLISKLTTEIYGKALSVCFGATKMKNVEEQVYEDAFYFAEKNRAFVLQKQIEEGLVMNQIPESLRKQYVEYISLIDYYKREVSELEQNNQESRDKKINEQLIYYNQQIVETREAYETLKKKLSTNFTSFQNLQESTKLVTTQEIRKNLKEDEQMLVYQWFKPYLFIQVIGKEKQLFYRIKPIDFEKIVKEYRNCLAKDCNTEKFVIQSNALYKILIQPIESHIKTSKKNIIIPDAILQQIPFSTLVSTSKKENNLSYQNLNYPLLNYQISFHYSSSLWVLARQKKDINYDYDFIGFAPVFGKHKEDSNPLLASNRSNLSPLPYSKNEVEEVANLFTLQDKKALAFTNLQANQENLRSYATKTRRLHLATHSQTFTKTPFNSHIWLFGQDSTQKNITTQKLYASDLYGMSFPNELVVLSSCRSGVGQVVEGEGVITLTRSFLNAGTKNIIFSLWQIDDLATKELMTLFYGFVSEGKTYSESLQLAKQKLSKSEKFNSPFYWAGILLIGE